MKKLNPEEMTLIRKLCQPRPFYASDGEIKLLASMLKRRIVIHHNDGSYEISDHGADIAIATLDV